MHARVLAVLQQPRLRAAAAVAACVLLLALIVDRIDPALPWPPKLDALSLIFANTMPVLIAWLLAFALTRRLWFACWLTALAVVGLYAANEAKIAHLEAPLLPGDLRLLAEPGPALNLLGRYVAFDLRIVALAALGLLVSAWLYRRRATWRLAGWRRTALAAAAVLLGLSLVAGAGPWRRLYDADRLGFEPWALSESTQRIGLIGILLLYHWELGSGDVPAADRDAAIALLRRHAEPLRERLRAAPPAHELPDIVVLQSESLFDPARLRGVAEGRFLGGLRDLAARASAGEMRVPTFGGGTIRTEFEVLTGAPLASLGGVQYPWLELRDARLPGLVSTLAARGYDTVAVHPNAAGFWNRRKAYAQLGFERFVDSREFPPDAIVGLFTSDAALTDRVLDELADAGAPRFVFAISMENHGPYDWRPGLDPVRYHALPLPARLDETGRFWLANYLYLLDDADHELMRLVGALHQRTRRTVLLFYGDHLPALQPVYEQLGFDDGREAKEQSVPWLIYDTADATPRRADTQSWLLPAQLLKSAGVEDDYFLVVEALRELLDLGSEAPADDIGHALRSLARAHLRGEFADLLAAALSEREL
ncbi:MAG: LTA synthase family protein [Rudaea sp.]|uniref:LTA synthase family protein n=1 Tax=unclassified Rudaea TaxID=2627037 RepID=UPI0010F643A0|nr:MULTISPECIES: LTA synthase family protein [unclassified Rudaea]MBN8887249.1 LTA synthase family protein [Rudaea sp.]